MKTLHRHQQSVATDCVQSMYGQSGEEAFEPSPDFIAQNVIDACLEAKGREISVLDVRDVFHLADYFVIVSGRSDRQTQGIANRILETLAKQGIQPEFVEGYDEGHWIIIDCIDVVIHIFYEPVREQYDLEGLWVKATKMVLTRDSQGREILSAA